MISVSMLTDRDDEPSDLRLVGLRRIRGSRQDIDTLFELLKHRATGISHREMPSFSDHVKFVKNHPYRFWYIVELSKSPIGSLYFSFENSIGISIPNGDSSLIASVLKRATSLHKPLAAIRSVRPSNFYVNSHPFDHRLIRALESMDWKLLQLSYTSDRTSLEGD